MSGQKTPASAYGTLIVLGFIAVFGSACFITKNDDGPKPALTTAIAAAEITRMADRCATGFAQLCVPVFSSGYPAYLGTIPELYSRASTSATGYNALAIAPAFAPFARQILPDSNWSAFGVEPHDNPPDLDPAVQILDLRSVKILKIEIAKSSRRLARVDWSGSLVPNAAYDTFAASPVRQSPQLLADRTHAGTSTGIIHGAFFFNGTRWIYDPGQLHQNQFLSPLRFVYASFIWTVVAIGVVILGIVFAIVFLTLRILRI